MNLDAIKLDVTDEIDRQHAFGYDVDILVLNAGIQEAGSLVEIPMARVRRSFEVNVFGHPQLVQEFAPQMLSRGSGKIFWVSSAVGIRTRPWVGTYATTKHAIEALAWAMKWSSDPAVFESPQSIGALTARATTTRESRRCSSGGMEFESQVWASKA